MRIAAAAISIMAWAAAAHAADTPAGWTEVKAGNMFTLQAPPGTTFERIRTGVDAFAGTFHGLGFDIAVEFGYHRDGMKNPAGAKNLAVTKLTVDEKPGSITTADIGDAAHPRFVGLYVPDVEYDPLGPLSLVMTATVAKPEDAALFRTMSETIRFAFKNDTPPP